MLVVLKNCFLETLQWLLLWRRDLTFGLGSHLTAKNINFQERTLHFYILGQYELLDIHVQLASMEVLLVHSEEDSKDTPVLLEVGELHASLREARIHVSAIFYWTHCKLLGIMLPFLRSPWGTHALFYILMYLWGHFQCILLLPLQSSLNAVRNCRNFEETLWFWNRSSKSSLNLI